MDFGLALASASALALAWLGPALIGEELHEIVDADVLWQDTSVPGWVMVSLRTRLTLGRLRL